MSSVFPPSQSELLETFEELEDWEERYEFLLDLGRELPALDAQLQTAENKVHGCMSTVWLAIEPVPLDEGNTGIHIKADSDSIIVKGLIVLLLSFYDRKTAEASAAEDPKDFLNTLGLNQHLSPTVATDSIPWSVASGNSVSRSPQAAESAAESTRARFSRTRFYLLEVFQRGKNRAGRGRLVQHVEVQSCRILFHQILDLTSGVFDSSF